VLCWFSAGDMALVLALLGLLSLAASPALVPPALLLTWVTVGMQHGRQMGLTGL